MLYPLHHPGDCPPNTLDRNVLANRILVRPMALSKTLINDDGWWLPVRAWVGVEDIRLCCRGEPAIGIGEASASGAGDITCTRVTRSRRAQGGREGCVVSWCHSLLIEFSFAPEYMRNHTA